MGSLFLIGVLIAAGLALGYQFGRRGRAMYGWFLVLVLVLAIYELMSVRHDIGLGFLHSNQGWGSLGDAIIALGFLSPAAIALVIGLLWGKARRPATIETPDA